MTVLPGDAHEGVKAEPSDNLRCLAYGQLAEEMQTCLQKGDRPDIQALARKYPSLVDEIPDLLSALATLQCLGQVSKHDDRSMTGTGGNTTGQLGDFRILRQVGRGGMGIVYEAQQISLQRRVALKMLPFAAVLDARQLQRFKNEAVAAASLKHPHIVQVYSVGCERGVHYYAMEYVEGQTLAEVIGQLRQLSGLASKDEPAEQSLVSQLTRSLAAGRLGLSPARPGSDTDTADYGPAELGRVRTLPDNEKTTSSTAETKREPQGQVSTDGTPQTPGFFRCVADWGTQASEALEHAHQMGVVHRDIKPSNLLIDAKGHLLITDFGLAQTRTGANLTMTGDLLGTLRYMSPEQAQGNRQVLDHRADIYSLGVTLYELLALRPPFESDDRHLLMHEIVDGDPPPPGQVNHAIPHDLETIVLKAMAAEPQSRYTTAQELADDLQRFLADEPIRARRASLANRTAKWVRRHRPVVWSAAILLVTAAVAIAGLAWNRYRQSVQLASDVGAHVAAADAFLKSADYAAGDRELADARGHLETADYGSGPLSEEVDRLTAEFAAKQRAIEQFDQFQQLRHRIHSEMYAVNQVILDQAQSHCRTALDLYGAMESDSWKQQRGFQDLSPERQATLEVGVVEMLFVWARLEIGKSDGQPPAELQAGGRRAVDAFSRIHAFQKPIPALYLWIADCWETAGDKKAAAQVRAKAEAIGPSTAMDYFVLGEHHAQHGRFDQAVASYWQALSRQPDHYLSLLASGVALGELKKHESAEAMLTGAIAMNPQTVLAFAKRGISRLGQGKILLAQADFQQATKLDPELARALTRRATTYRENFEFDKALADCTEAIRLDPKSGLAYAERSVLHLIAGNLDAALADCTEAIRLEPESASFYVTRADIYNLKGQADKAMADCNEGIRLDPNSAWGYRVRSVLYREKRELERAQADLTEALRLDPRLVGLRGLYYQASGERDKALADFDEAIRLNPKDVWTYFSRTALHLENGDFSKALADSNEVVRIAPKMAGAYSARGNAYAAQGDSDKALADYTEAIRLEPSSAVPYVARAAFHNAQGDRDKAIADCNEAIRLDPKLPGAYIQRGTAYAAKGDRDKALADYNEAIRVNPQNVDGYVYAERGTRYLDLNEFEKAAADLDRAAELGPISWHFYKRRALAHFQLQHYDKALESIAKAVDLRPEDGSNLIWIPPEEVATCPDDRLRTGLLELADKTIEKTKGAAEAYAVRARLYAAFGQPEKALADYTEAIRLEPQDAMLYDNRGVAYFLQREWDKAIADFSEVIRLEPEFAFSYHGRGEAYEEKGDNGQAFADLSKAAELRPDDGSFWYHRALARLAAGQANEHRDDCVEMLQRFAQSGTPDNAYWAAWTCVLGPDAVTDWSKPLTLAEKAAQSDPKAINYANTVGAILYRAGRLDEAVQRLTAADQLAQEPTSSQPSSPAYTWFFLAMAHHRLGHTEEAKQWLDKAVAWTVKTTTEADQGKADLPWNRRLTLKLLRDEATTLLGVTLPTVESAPEPAAKVEEAQEPSKSTPAPEPPKEEEQPK